MNCPVPKPLDPFQSSLPVLSDLLHHRLWVGAFPLCGPLAALLGCPAAPWGALLPAAVGSVPKEAPPPPWGAHRFAGVLQLAQHWRGAQALQSVPCCRDEPVSTG